MEDYVFTVPLEVVNSAPAAQGFVGSGEPTPNPGGTDTDGDGVPDSLEVAYGSNPNSASSIPGQVDTDGDGIDDGSDSAPNDPCIPSAFNAACTQDNEFLAPLHSSNASKISSEKCGCYISCEHLQTYALFENNVK